MSGRSSSKVKFKGIHKRHVTLISESSDHKTTCVTKILVTVREVRLNALNATITTFPVVSKLRDPLELRDITDLLINEPLDDISSVHIDDNQSTKCDFLKLLERSTH